MGQVRASVPRAALWGERARTRGFMHDIQGGGEGSITSTYVPIILHGIFLVRAGVERARDEGQIGSGGDGQPCARRSMFAER